MRTRFALYFLAAVHLVGCGGTIADPTNTRSSTSGTPSAGSGGANDGTPSSGSGRGGSSGMPGGDGDPALIDQPIFTAQDVFFRVQEVYFGAVAAPCTDKSLKAFTYDRAKHELTSRRCADSQDPAERDAWPAISRVLEPAEAERIETFIQAMRATQKPATGGWDGREYFLEVGSRKYSQWNINFTNLPNAPKTSELFMLLESIPL